MTKLNEAKAILKELGVPAPQQSDICGYALLALANLAETNDWSSSTKEWIRIHDIIVFVDKTYKVTYAENTREIFRKQAIHHFRNAAFIEDDNEKVTNSPNYRYRLTDEMLALVQLYNTDGWDDALKQFLNNHETLIDLYASKKKIKKCQ